MRCMKISTALLAVPVCVFALACESDTATEESLVAPPGPSFAHFPAALTCTHTAGVEAHRQGPNAWQITGTSGPDTINCTGETEDVTIIGGDGNDILTCGTGNCRLVGGNGNDDLNGGTGNDHLIGGKQNDDCSGGGGVDRFQGCETIS